MRAQVRSLESLSAHADANEILFWLKSFQAPPRRTFIVHGEPKASTALAERIGSTFRWTSHIPEYLETVELVYPNLRIQDSGTTRPDSILNPES